MVIGASYVLGERIGGGGQADIFEGRHPELGAVAVKVMKVSSREDSIERLRRECRALWSLRHPNVVLVHDAGVGADGRPFFVMDRLEGESLFVRLRRLHWVEVGEAVRIATAVLSALSAAHARGIVHRDVKPGNVFIERDGGVKLLDFGIAKLLEDNNPLTLDNVVVGTPRYTAPEQVTGDDVDPRTDLYGVGLLLFEMLCGEPPFGRDAATEENLRAHAEHRAPRLDSMAKVPRGLNALVIAALSKDPADRPRSADEFAARLVQATRPRRSGWVAVAVAVPALLAASIWLPLRRQPSVPGRPAIPVVPATLVSSAMPAASQERVTASPPVDSSTAPRVASRSPPLRQIAPVPPIKLGPVRSSSASSQHPFDPDP